MTPNLLGLVLAGGASRRMGRDKGSLTYYAEPQAVHAWRLLTEVCGRAYVSTNARHAGIDPYSELPLIVDEGDYLGPAAGLAAAWGWHPDAAWLVLAVDMPLVDRKLLAELVAARDPSALATAFTHGEGRVEPLCTIWEPAAREPLIGWLAAGDASPRRFLEAHATVLVTPSDPRRLCSVNGPDEHAALLRELGDP